MYIAFLFALLAVMVYLFLTEKIPVDLTAFLGLTVLIFGGYLEAGEAFQGFASPAVITMLSVFIVSAALLRTGLADFMGARIHAWVGGREIPLIVTLMLVAGVLSAFMNNIAATAVLMPAVAAVAQRSGLAPSRLFMPLAFGAILGGTTTLVGTPPNIVAGEMLRERGLEPFELFDFTPVGLVLLGVGTVFMTTFGRRLLPDHAPHAPRGDAHDLRQVYQLDERLFSLRLPADSHLDGVTLGESRLGSALGVQVVAVLRGPRRELAPSASTPLRGGDVLLVEGDRRDVEELLRVQGLEVERTEPEALPPTAGGYGGIRARLLHGSSLAGQSLREIGFRERFGLVVVGIRRGDEILRERLAGEVLAVGDAIFALGPRERLEALRGMADFEVRDVGFSAIRQLQDRLFAIRVPDGSPLAGRTLGESGLSEQAGLTVGGLIRDGETRLALEGGDRILAGDQLLVAAEPSRIAELVEVGELQLEIPAAGADLESEDVGVVEVALAPRSTVAGHTLRELEFRRRWGLLALALWRGGEPRHGDLADVDLRLGDALLLQGPRERIEKLAQDPDFVVLSPLPVERRSRKAPFALGGLLLMITLVVGGWQPIHVAAFTAASLVLLSGALTMEEAYRAIEWRAIFLVAAVLPVGIAMDRTGAALLLADSVTGLAGSFGPYAVLAVLTVLSSLLSQGLDGAPAVVLLTPVVLQAAETLGLSPYPLMMGISVAASAAFMTPFSHKANLLVMGAGGYHARDYLRVGTPLTVVLLALMVMLIPIFFPF